MVSRTSCFMCQITTQCKSSTIQGARLRRKEALVSFSLHGLSLPESPLDFVPHLDCTGGVVIDDGCGLSAAITASTAEVFPATCFGFCKLLGPSSLSSPFVVPSRWRLWRRRWPLKPGLRAHFEIARNLLRRDALRSKALRLILSLSRRTSAGPPDQNCAIAIPNSSAFCLRGLCWARRARSAVCEHYVTREPPVRLVMLAAWGGSQLHFGCATCSDEVSRQTCCAGRGTYSQAASMDYVGHGPPDQRVHLPAEQLGFPLPASCQARRLRKGDLSSACAASCSQSAELSCMIRKGEGDRELGHLCNERGRASGERQSIDTRQSS